MVLVNRFVDILLTTDDRVNELVAITFTEKAASELKKKIADVIDDRLHQAPGLTGQAVDDNVRARLEGTRAHLSFANIGTIHSFCAQLLREYPVEAGVDADFVVIERVDQQILEQESIQEALEEAVLETAAVSSESTAEEHVRQREDLMFSMRALGRRNMHKYLTFLLRKRDQVGRLAQGLFAPHRGDDDVLTRWNEVLSDCISRQLDEPRWRDAVQRLLRAARGKKASVVAADLNHWQNSLPLQQKIELYNRILSDVLTTKSMLRVQFIGKVDPVKGVDVSVDLREAVAYLAQHRKSLIPLFDGQMKENHRLLLRITRTLLGLTHRALRRYEAKKADNGVLDFEDLQLYAKALLQQQTVREQLARRFKFILVDEYQDTNLLQYEILRPLLLDFRTGNLFIVGDPKQSIFRFRDADVEVFDSTRRGVMEAGKVEVPFRWQDEELPSTAEERKGRVVLAESFRPLSQLVLFVNYVFSRIMAGPDSGIEYEELVHGRMNDAAGSVELMVLKPDGNGEGAKQNIITDECDMVARRILALRASGHVVYDRPRQGDGLQEVGRAFAFRDAAILLRSRRHLLSLEKALIKHKIPYIISGGIGFFQTQEIFDFLNYFRFLLNRHDDVALVGILRSPFFAVSDAELFEISLLRNHDDFWSKVVAYADRPNSSPSLKRAEAILLDNIAVANRMSIPLLVQRIFRQTGWTGAIAGIERGAQSIANVEKLLRIARDFEGRGFANLFDFVERLQRLVEEEEREGQASVEETEDCVQVMTIHAAKGLEFPVVFVPFCADLVKHDDAPYLDADIGLGFKFTADHDSKSEIVSPLFSLLRMLSSRKTEAEEKRVLYVACTRARDMLVISGQLNRRRKRSNYIDWILGALGLEEEKISDEPYLIPDQKIKVLEIVDGRYVPKEKNDILRIGVRTNAEFGEVPNFAAGHAEQPMPIEELYVDPLEAQTVGEFFSATQIMTYLECPTKYYLKYRLGLPEQGVHSYDFDENEDPNDSLLIPQSGMDEPRPAVGWTGILGQLEGSLTHAVLASIEGPEIDDTSIQNLIYARSQSLSFETEEQLQAVSLACLENVRGFVRSEFGKSVLSSKDFFAEYTINQAFGQDYLTGTIDRLYNDNEGRWCLLDYKTDKIKRESIAARAELYRPQVTFYALLVRKLFAQESVRATLLFTTYPEHPYHLNLGESELSSFEDLISKVVQRIRKGDFKREAGVCDTCTYFWDGRCIADVANGFL